MRKWVLTIATLGLVCVAASASGEQNVRNRYKWRDGQGNLHYDDALPDEALKYGYDVINPSGIVVKHVDRARTPEELKADKAAAEKASAAKRAADQQVQSDEQLIAAYPTEHDLLIAQQSQIDMIDQSMHATEVSMQNQEKSLTEMLTHAADFDRNGKPVPASLTQQIDQLRVTIEKQKAYLAGKDAEKQADQAKFQVDLQHYRDVQAAKH